MICYLLVNTLLNHNEAVLKERQTAVRIPTIHIGTLVNRAALKQRLHLHFQTVNHAKVVWDCDAKPKGIEY